MKNSIRIYDPDNVDPTDPAHKVRYLLDNIIRSAQKYYQPGKNLSVDESLVKFHGRWKHKVYISSKKAKWGIKFYCLCEAKTGYLYNWIIHAGRKTYDRMCFGTGVTLDLVNFIESSSGHEIYSDNYYTSPELAIELAKRGNIFSLFHILNFVFISKDLD